MCFHGICACVHTCGGWRTASSAILRRQSVSHWPLAARQAPAASSLRCLEPHVAYLAHLLRSEGLRTAQTQCCIHLHVIEGGATCKCYLCVAVLKWWEIGWGYLRCYLVRSWILLPNYFKNQHHEAQWCRALVALAQNPGSLPSTHTWDHNHL